MKKTIIACATAAIATLGLYAATDEIMVIKLTDGTTVEYNVKDVEMVNFDVRVTEDAFTVTPPAGDAAAYTTIPTMLRVAAASGSGNPTLFGFGTVAATAAEDLTTGEYGVYISLSASKVYNGDVDLATEKDSYTVKLVKYTEGGAEYILDEVTEGTLSTSLNSKTRKVTLTLDAVMKDGTAVTAKYEGVPADVESIEAMVPAIQYSNVGYYYDADGKESVVNIEKKKKKYSSYSKATTFTFVFDGYLGGQDEATLVIPDAIFESGETEFNLPEANGWQFKLGYMIQLYGPTGNADRDKYSNVADNGKMKVKKIDDNTYELFIEVQNYYNNYMGTHLGTPQKVIINYSGAI